MNDDELKKISDDVKREGFVIWNISHTDVADADKPEFSYTTGLFRTKSHPEIILFGIDRVRNSVLHRLAMDVMNGSKFDAGCVYPEIVGQVHCTFRRVDDAHYEKYLGHSMQYYQFQYFPVLQCVWPDKSDRLPWQPNFDERFRWEQDLLFDTSSVTRWRQS